MTPVQCGLDEHLAAVIVGLPRTLRVVFVMAHVQRRSREEIAASLGISAKRVDRRMTKALRECRDRLEKRGISLDVPRQAASR